MMTKAQPDQLEKTAENLQREIGKINSEAAKLRAQEGSVRLDIVRLDELILFGEATPEQLKSAREKLASLTQQITALQSDAADKQRLLAKAREILASHASEREREYRAELEHRNATAAAMVAEKLVELSRAVAAMSAVRQEAVERYPLGPTAPAWLYARAGVGPLAKFQPAAPFLIGWFESLRDELRVELPQAVRDFLRTAEETQKAAERERRERQAATTRASEALRMLNTRSYERQMRDAGLTRMVR